MSDNRTRVINAVAGRYDINIGRGWHADLGNPFTVVAFGRELACELYKVYLYRRAELDEAFKAELIACDGKVLGCPGNCKPRRCHGDTIIEWLDNWKSGQISA